MPRPCLYCQERIADDSTICLRCGTFDPFAAPPPSPPSAPNDGRTASSPETEGQLEPSNPGLSRGILGHYENKAEQASGKWRAFDSVRPVSLPPLKSVRPSESVWPVSLPPFEEAKKSGTWPWLAFLILVLLSHLKLGSDKVELQEKILGTPFENAVVPTRVGIGAVIILSFFVSSVCGS